MAEFVGAKDGRHDHQPLGSSLEGMVEVEAIEEEVETGAAKVEHEQAVAELARASLGCSAELECLVVLAGAVVY